MYCLNHNFSFSKYALNGIWWTYVTISRKIVNYMKDIASKFAVSRSLKFIDYIRRHHRVKEAQNKFQAW